MSSSTTPALAPLATDQVAIDVETHDKIIDSTNDKESANVGNIAVDGRHSSHRSHSNHNNIGNHHNSRLSGDSETDEKKHGRRHRRRSRSRSPAHSHSPLNRSRRAHDTGVRST